MRLLLVVGDGVFLPNQGQDIFMSEILFFPESASQY